MSTVTNLADYRNRTENDAWDALDIEAARLCVLLEHTWVGEGHCITVINVFADDEDRVVLRVWRASRAAVLWAAVDEMRSLP